MLGAMALLPFLDVVAKHLGRQGVPVMQVVWARLFFGALITFPIALRLGGLSGLRPNMPIMHTFRASLIIAATAFFFAALQYMSIAETLAIFFVQPLVVTMLSPLMLGEHVGVRRWLAVFVGFSGTLIIIRPGFQELNPGMLLALLSGVSLAIYLIFTRKIAGSAPAMLTTFYTNIAGAVLMCILVAFFWKTPTYTQWGLFVLLALIACLGHYLIVKAYDYAEASLLAPLAYTEMIMATFAGWYFFGDFPDYWTFVGVSVLISSAIYISWRERIRHAPPNNDFE
jgi:drug/metabolite transporter (DMT)-like permease